MSIDFVKVYSFKTHLIVIVISIILGFIAILYSHEHNIALINEHILEKYGDNFEKYEDGHFIGYDEEDLEFIIASYEKNYQENERALSLATLIVSLFIFSGFYFYYLFLRLNRDKPILLFLFLPLILSAIMISYFVVVPLIIYNIILFFKKDIKIADRKKMFKIIVTVYTIIYIVVTGFLFFKNIFRKVPQVKFAENLEVCTNDVVYNNNFILKVTNGELVINDEKIDTTTEGKKLVFFDVINNYGEIENYHYTIIVRDCE